MKEKILIPQKISHFTIHSQKKFFFSPSLLTLCIACTSESRSRAADDGEVFCCFSPFGEHLIKNSRDDLNVNLTIVFVTAEWMYLATVWLSNSPMYAILNVSLKFRFIIQSQVTKALKRKWNLLIFLSAHSTASCRRVSLFFSILLLWIFATDRAPSVVSVRKIHSSTYILCGSLCVRTDYLIRHSLMGIRIAYDSYTIYRRLWIYRHAVVWVVERKKVEEGRFWKIFLLYSFRNKPG